MSIASGSATLKLKSTDNGAGISVIKNGESFKMANIAEVKLNFDDSSRVPRSKPSCAVKPIVKASPTKPSATVRPLNIQEALLKEKETEEKCRIGEISSPVQTKVASPVRNEDEGLQVVPDASLSTPKSSGSLDIKEPVKEEKSSVLVDDVPVLQTNNSPELARGVHIPEPRPVDIPSEPEVKPNTCRVVPCVPHTNGVMTASEDTFNADIVCPHGNLRIEERCKQLISREVWFKLCSYFHNPKTFQFGKLTKSAKKALRIIVSNVE